MKKFKICMIIPYFGEFPKWFELYLLTCSKVSQIDFYYITDCKVPNKSYKNTFFIKSTFKDYCNLVSKKLNIHFYPSGPYKLCDLKPFLGIIHKELIEDYDFWGFSDIDLIYGDVSDLLNQKILSEHDVISTHADRVAGHFTIIRTKSKYTYFCKKIHKWEAKLEKNEELGIDESDFSLVLFPRFIIERIVWKLIVSRIIGNNNMYRYYDYLHSKFSSRVLLREYYTTPIPSGLDTFKYDLQSNKLIAPKAYVEENNITKKIPYLHFLFFKKTKYLETSNYWKENFYRLPDHIYDNNGIIYINSQCIELVSNSCK